LKAKNGIVRNYLRHLFSCHSEVSDSEAEESRLRIAPDCQFSMRMMPL